MEYGVREVAQLLGLTERQVRRYVQDGFVDPERGPRGRLRFGFQDLVLLRTAKRLLDAEVGPRRVRKALSVVRSQLPAGEPLSQVQVALEGDELVVSDGSGRWAPESGQSVFSFEEEAAPVEAIEASVPMQLVTPDDDEPEWQIVLSSPLPTPIPEEGPSEESASAMGCADWMDLAEAYHNDRRPNRARDALRRALEVEPLETEARVRLARLLEADGRIESAERHYRLARRLRPHEPEIALDHGRLQAQLGDLRSALDAFETAIALDPDLIDAYLAAADMNERLGYRDAAEQVLNEVRRRRQEPPEE